MPNVVTSIRLVMVPVFVWLLVQPRHRDWFGAAVLLAALGSTDWLDGQLARRLDQVTNLGKVLDPTADRTLLAAAVIGILALGAVPVPIAVLAISREGLVAVAAVVLALLGARRIDVTLVGKAGTFGLMCAFPLFLAGHSTVGWRHARARRWVGWPRLRDWSWVDFSGPVRTAGPCRSGPGCARQGAAAHPRERVEHDDGG